MAITNNALSNSTAASIFTSAGTHGDAVTTMYFCNTTASQQTVNVFVVANGDVADPGLNIIYSNVAIAAGDTLVTDMAEKLILGIGDSIQANASTSSGIVSTISTLGI